MDRPVKKGPRAAAVAAFAALCALVGCSAEGGGTNDGLGPGVSYNGSAGGGERGMAGGGAGAAGFAGTVASYSGGTGGTDWTATDSGIDKACASFSTEAKQVEVEVPTEVQVEVVVGSPVAIYLMQDQSWSMNEQSGATNKWQTAVDSINAFVNDPTSTNIDIALQYFALPGGDCATGAGYDTPEVPLGTLPGHAANISASLAAHFPGAGGDPFTPIEGALRGLTAFCTRFKQDPVANPDGEDCVAVLVTDGIPTTCNLDWNVLIGIAADAYNNYGVMTFAIGMAGADFNLLDQIAMAGGGDCTPDPADPTWACNVSTGQITFLDALNQIRDMVTELQTITQIEIQMQPQALECEWEIPEPPAGEQFNPDKVNIQFSASGVAGDEQIIGRVNSADRCGDQLAWHYDDPNNPASMVACPKTCDTIQAAPTGRIDILLGCGTLLIE